MKAGKNNAASQAVFHSKDSLEQATPEAVARYRAKRLKTSIAVDLCCGIGVDAIALARNCGKVYAFDIDGNAISSARKNSEALGIKNIEFYCADCFGIDLKKIRPDVAFADPSRRIKGVRVKGLDETVPNTKRIIEFIKGQGITDFCIEASAAIDLAELPAECEKEMVSLNGEPNCISLYFGGLKKANYSFVSLPSGKRLECDSTEEKIRGGKPLALRYIYEVDEGISRIKMQKQAYDSLGKAKEEAFLLNEFFFGATQKILSPFFKNSFKVLAILHDNGELAERLNKLKAKKVVLRGKFSSEAEQLQMKSEIESKLSGKHRLHIFFFWDSTIVGKKLDV